MRPEADALDDAADADGATLDGSHRGRHYKTGRGERAASYSAPVQDPPGDLDAAKRLEAEIADLSRQLSALPLEKQHRDERLKLNDLKRAKESELAAARRGAELAGMRSRLRAIDAELEALGKGPATRDRRQQLLKEQREAKLALELAERGGPG